MATRRTSQRLAVDSEDSLADAETFEKIRPWKDGALPVASSRMAIRSSRKTSASRRANKRIARKMGGIHRRRIKKIK